MLDKLSQKDKKAIAILVVFSILMTTYVIGSKLVENWKQTRLSYQLATAELKNMIITTSAHNITGTPQTFVFPENSGEGQILAFRDSLNAQLRKAGIKSNPLQIVGVSAYEKVSGYQLVRIQGTGTGSFDQLLNMMAGLYENQHLLGLDRLKFTVQQGNNQASFEMTALTLTK